MPLVWVSALPGKQVGSLRRSLRLWWRLRCRGRSQVGSCSGVDLRRRIEQSVCNVGLCRTFGHCGRCGGNLPVKVWASGCYPLTSSLAGGAAALAAVPFLCSGALAPVPSALRVGRGVFPLSSGFVVEIDGVRGVSFFCCVQSLIVHIWQARKKTSSLS